MNTRSLFLLALTLCGAQLTSAVCAQAPAVTPQPVAPAPAAPVPAPGLPPTPPPAVQPTPSVTPEQPAPEAQPSPSVQPRAESARPVLVQPGPPSWVQQAPPRRYGPPPSARRQRLPSPQLHPIERRRYGKAGAPFALGLGGSLLWHDDHAYDVLSDRKSTGAFELFASYDVWSHPAGVILALGASLRRESRVGSEDYDLRNHAVQAEAMLRYGVGSWLWPHLRLAVGGVTTRFKQHDVLADLTFEDRSGSAMGTFGAGFSVRTPTRFFETHRGRLASLSLGLLIEGGYTLAKDAKLDLKPTRAGEVTRATFSLGSVERSAPYLRIMGVIRL